MDPGTVCCLQWLPLCGVLFALRALRKLVMGRRGRVLAALHLMHVLHVCTAILELSRLTLCADVKEPVYVVEIVGKLLALLRLVAGGTRWAQVAMVSCAGVLEAEHRHVALDPCNGCKPRGDLTAQ